MIWHTSGWFLILCVFIFDYKPPTAVAGFLVCLKIKFSPTHDPKTKSSQSSHKLRNSSWVYLQPPFVRGGYCMFLGDISMTSLFGIFTTQFGELIQVDLHAFFAVKKLLNQHFIHTSPRCSMYGIFTSMWLKLLVFYVNIPVPWSIFVQIYTQDSSFWISYYNSWCRISSNNSSSG